MSDQMPKDGPSVSAPVEFPEPATVPPVQTGTDNNQRVYDSMDLPAIPFNSNYPRMGRTVFGQSRRPGIYWDSVSTAFSMVGNHPIVFGFGGLITSAIAFAAYSMVAFFMFRGITLGYPPEYRLFMIVPQLIAQYILMFPLFGLITMAVKHAQGNEPQVTDFLIPFQRMNTTSQAALLAALPMMAVTVLLRLIQAGVYGNSSMLIAVDFVFFVIAILVHLGCTGQLLLSGTSSILTGKSPITTAKALYQRMGRHVFGFGLLFLCSQLISFIGAFALIVGVVFTIPVFTNVLGIHYMYNFPEDQAPTAYMS